MKVLISWVADKHDFNGGAVNKQGPTYRFHQHHFDHDKHIILSSAKKDNTKLEHLLNQLNRDFKGRSIEPRYLNITDVISVAEIQPKINRLLLEYSDDEIDIFISPGTPAMQVVWYLSHITLNLNTALYQTRPVEFSRDKVKGDLVKVDVQQSSIPVAAILRENETERRIKTDYNITPAIRPVYDRADKVASAEGITVLILGASGTGKEHLARYIHDSSARRSKAYIALNCSALSDQLLESRLFGYMKGSFTGALNNTKGILEECSGGTVFLDEIGDISPSMQQLLLRVLQEKEITPIGGKPKTVDVRVIAATNRNLQELCEQGKFRWDLFYRLSVAELELSSLLERGKKETELMIRFFIKTKQKQLKKGKAIEFTPEAMNMLLNYSWPGNIRQLENFIERLYVYHEGTIESKDLPAYFVLNSAEMPLHFDHVEKEHIKKVLSLKKGNQKQTVEALGWTINTLKARLKKYKIDPEKFR